MRHLKAKTISLKWVRLISIGALLVLSDCKKESENELLPEQTLSPQNSISPSSILPQKHVFSFTGADQQFVVPADVTQITVKAWGAGGGGGNYLAEDGYNNKGGGGGFVTGVINVLPGDSLTIIVGEGGKTGAGPGAYGGGGAKSCGDGGRGGGRSAVINSLGQELITAGAGGGGGGVAFPDEVGGHGGGGLTGEPDNWTEVDGIPATPGGGPGTQTGGGYAGISPGLDCTCGSNPGALHQGGDADCFDDGHNGSGGSGYYGGGSGTDVGDGAGGGGSSFVPSGGSTVSAISEIPGNNLDEDYDETTAHGGQAGMPGGDGSVVFEYTPNPPSVIILVPTIDIIPGKFPNIVKCKTPNTEIPVAILTTVVFDAATADPATVRFGKLGTEAANIKKKTLEDPTRLKDVDKDGDLDLLLHFLFKDTGLQCSDTEGFITGMTKDNKPFKSSDSIKTDKK